MPNFLKGGLLLVVAIAAIAGLASSFSTLPPSPEPSTQPQATPQRDTFDFARDKQIQSQNRVRMPGDLFPSYMDADVDLSTSEVSLKIEDGSIVCGDPNNYVDMIAVSFDGVRDLFTCHESQTAVDSMTVGPIYLDNADRFIQKAQRAKHISISPLVMGSDRVTFEFAAH